MTQMTEIAQNFRELPTNKVIAKENVNPIFETNNFSRGLFDEPKEFYLSDKQINKRFLSELPGYYTIYEKTPEKAGSMTRMGQNRFQRQEIGASEICHFLVRE